MCAFYFIPFFSNKKHKWVYVYAWTCYDHKSRNLCPWSKPDIELSGFGQASSWGSPNKNPSLTWNMCRILLSSLQPWHVTVWLTIKINQGKNKDFRSALSQDWNTQNVEECTHSCRIIFVVQPVGGRLMKKPCDVLGTDTVFGCILNTSGAVLDLMFFTFPFRWIYFWTVISLCDWKAFFQFAFSTATFLCLFVSHWLLLFHRHGP